MAVTTQMAGLVVCGRSRAPDAKVAAKVSHTPRAADSCDRTSTRRFVLPRSGCRARAAGSGRQSRWKRSIRWRRRRFVRQSDVRDELIGGRLRIQSKPLRALGENAARGPQRDEELKGNLVTELRDRLVEPEQQPTLLEVVQGASQRRHEPCPTLSGPREADGRRIERLQIVGAETTVEEVGEVDDPRRPCELGEVPPRARSGAEVVRGDGGSCQEIHRQSRHEAPWFAARQKVVELVFSSVLPERLHDWLAVHAERLEETESDRRLMPHLIRPPSQPRFVQVALVGETERGQLLAPVGLRGCSDEPKQVVARRTGHHKLGDSAELSGREIVRVIDLMCHDIHDLRQTQCWLGVDELVVHGRFPAQSGFPWARRRGRWAAPPVMAPPGTEWRVRVPEVVPTCSVTSGAADVTDVTRVPSACLCGCLGDSADIGSDVPYAHAGWSSLPLPFVPVP